MAIRYVSTRGFSARDVLLCGGRLIKWRGSLVSVGPCLLSLSVMLLPAVMPGTVAAQTWKGSMSSDWTTATNWSTGAVPTTGTVIINTMSPNPTVLGVSAAASRTSGTINIGSASGASGSLTIQNGSTLTSSGVGYIGNASGSTGVVTVTGSGSKWANSSTLNVGASGTGTLNILSSGTVTNAAGVVGQLSGSTGTVNVNAGTWTNGSTLYVGQYGTGTVAVSNAGAVSVTGVGYIGYAATATGVVTVDGSGSTFSTTSSLAVGQSGKGTLTVSNGGVVTTSLDGLIGNASGSTGTVAVTGSGSKWTVSRTLDVGNAGNGSLSVLNGAVVTDGGTFVVGNGAGITGTVAIDGTGSTLNVGYYPASIGSSGTGTVSITNGGALVAQTGYSTVTLGAAATGVGSVTLDGSGSTWTTTNTTIGGLGKGTFNVTDGGVANTGYTFVGNSAGSTGSITVDGSGSKWIGYNSTVIGFSGTGSLTVTNGGYFFGSAGNNASQGLQFGRNVGSVGTGTIDGAGSTLATDKYIDVGGLGTGTLTVTNGATVTAGGIYIAGSGISSGTTGIGTLTADGAGTTVSASGTLDTGSAGTGTLTIQNGATATSSGGLIGGGAWTDTDNLFYTTANGTALLTGAGTSWTNSGTLYVGPSGTGTLTVQDGAIVANTNTVIGGGLTLTFSSGNTYTSTTGTGTVLVTGSGSSLTNSGTLIVGATADGNLTVENSAALTSASAAIGNTSTGTGVATVTGSGSTWTNSGEIVVGEAGTGTLNIAAAAAVTSASGILGDVATSNGTVDIDGAGSAWTSSGDWIAGNAGTGTLTVENAGTLTSGNAFVGNASTGTGTVLITGLGSTWTSSGALVVGEAGNGTLNITDGADVKSLSSIIGDAETGVGIVNLDGAGSTWDDTGDPIVGNAGTGTLSITNGATLTSTVSVLGNQSTGTGTVTVDGAGSSWTDNSSITVGNYGKGTLNITDSGLVTAKGGTIVAAESGSTGTINMSGGAELQTLALTGGSGTAQANFDNAELTALANNSAFVSGFSAGELNIENGGLTIDNQGYAIVSESPFSGTGALTSESSGTLITTAANTYTGGTTIASGTLQLGDGGASGSIVGDVSDNGMLAFDRSDVYTFSGVISGSGSLSQIGSGATVLDGISTYTGTTTVAAGTLAVGDASHTSAALTGAGATTVDAGATLGGYGSVSGTVTNDGTVAAANAVAAFGSDANGNFTIDGTLVNNALAQVGGNGIGNTLTVNSYIGNQGTLALNTYLGADNSPSDLLVVDGGSATGSSTLQVTNVGGGGALTTGNGILVIDAINGATTSAGAFTLGSRLIAGPYEYSLYRGSVDGSSTQDWYLRSTMPASSVTTAATDATTTASTSASTTVVQIPEYRQEVSLYTALPSMTEIYGRELLGTLHERIGEQEQLSCGCAFHSERDWGNGAWGRVVGTYGTQGKGTIYNGDPEFKYGLGAAQIGGDLFRDNHDGRQTYAGLYGAIGHMTGDVDNYTGELAGRNSFSAYSVGAYGTHYGASGWYVDGVLQGTWYDNVKAQSSSTSSSGSVGLSTHGVGVAGSLEVGYPLPFVSTWHIEPQAQVVYQAISLDTSADVAATVRFPTAESLAARLGGRFSTTRQRQYGDRERLYTLWVDANLWHEFKGDNRTQFSSATGYLPFYSRLGGSWGELGAGMSSQITRHISFYTHLGYEVGLNADRHAVSGKLGVRANW